MEQARRPTPVVRTLEPDAFEAGAHVLSRAFAEEALFASLLGGDAEQRARLLPGLMRGMLEGHAPVSELDGVFVEDRLVAVAISITPEHFPLKVGSMLTIARKALPPALKLALSKPGILKLFRAASLLEKQHPKEACYYLAFFGVDPASRQGGVAEKLARTILARADARKVGCYLDTAGRNTMRMCRFLGFEVRHQIEPFPEGPTCYGMWRRPR